MTYQEVLENAKKRIGPKCRVCPVCDGRACRGIIPGPGGIGSGESFVVSHEYLQAVKINSDPLHEDYDIDMSIDLFGRSFDAPFFAAPIGGLAMNYSDAMNEEEYSLDVTKGCRDAGTFAWTCDGAPKGYYEMTLPAIKAVDGLAISTIKPWAQEEVLEKLGKLKELHPMGFAMDVDAAALVNMKIAGHPVYPKSGRQLREIAQAGGMPFVVKGIMTPKSADVCADAGAYGIVVSSHGGRILADNPAPCQVLPAIRRAVGSSMKIFVDGGIRSGGDVFKCLALGADAVLIGRPYAVSVYGGGREGARLYTEKIKSELHDTMLMTGCRTLKDITGDKIVMNSLAGFAGQ